MVSWITREDTEEGEAAGLEVAEILQLHKSYLESKRSGGNSE